MTKIHIKHSAGSMEKDITIEIEDENTTVEVLAEILKEDRVRQFENMVAAAVTGKDVPQNIFLKLLEKAGLY